MARGHLSARQRSATRTVHDDPETAGEWGRGTIDSLVRRGLVRWDSTDGWLLTRQGVHAYEQIMASGDGPEDLKEMFRFLGARR